MFKWLESEMYIEMVKVGLIIIVWKCEDFDIKYMVFEDIWKCFCRIINKFLLEKKNLYDIFWYLIMFKV